MTFASWASPVLSKWLATIPPNSTINLSLIIRADGLENMICEAILSNGRIRTKVIREPRRV